MGTLIETYRGRTAAYGLTDQPVGLGYNQHRTVNRANAESLARNHPETWRISKGAPMEDALKWFTLVMKYFPIVFGLIKEVQDTIPHAPGAAKSALVTAVVAPPTEDAAGVQKLINTIVTTNQATGVMVKDQPLTKPPTAAAPASGHVITLNPGGGVIK